MKARLFTIIFAVCAVLSITSCGDDPATSSLVGQWASAYYVKDGNKTIIDSENPDYRIYTFNVDGSGSEQYYCSKDDLCNNSFQWQPESGYVIFDYDDGSESFSYYRIRNGILEMSTHSNFHEFTAYIRNN